jgi:hypothetical protein
MTRVFGRFAPKLLLSLSMLTAVAAPAHAQIVAQSNFVQRTAANVPQVSVIVRADFVLFTVSYESGTRSESEREDELARTFQNVVQRVGRTNGEILVEVGRPGASAAIETAAIKEVVVDEGERSKIDLVLKVAVKPDESFDQLRARTEAFVAGVPVAGRVEAVIGDSQFLEASDPKKHRDTLVQAIAADVKMMQTAFSGGMPVAVTVTGLEGRTQSRPAGPLDLEIYIPYSLSLRTGVSPPP